MENITTAQFPTAVAGNLSPEFHCYQEVFEDMAANLHIPISAGVPGQDGVSAITEVLSFRECFAVPSDGSDYVWTAPNEFAANSVVTWGLQNAPGINHWIEPNTPSQGQTTVHFNSSDGNPIDVQDGSEICYLYQLTRVGYDNTGDGQIDQVLSGPPLDINPTP